MRRRVLRQASCLTQNAGYVPGCLRRRNNDSEGGLSEKSQAEHQRCTELHRDLLSGCNIHRCARLGVRPTPPAERYGHLMRPRGRGKEVGPPASNFRPPVDGDSRLDEGGQWRQPVDPTPDTDARLRRRHGPNVSRRGRCPERRERVSYRPRLRLYHGHRSTYLWRRNQGTGSGNTWRPAKPLKRRSFRQALTQPGASP